MISPGPAIPSGSQVPGVQFEFTSDLYDATDGTNRCLLCKSPRYRLFQRVTRYSYPFEFQRCACGLIKQTPMPTARFFEAFFNAPVFYSAKATGAREVWGYYDYFSEETARMRTARLRYARLSGYWPRQRPLLIMKIGPGTGTFLYVARQHGHRVSGCDVSDRFVGNARSHYGLEIQRGRFEELSYPDASFDVVLLFNVIENLPHPEVVLSAVHRTLKPGGVFVLNYVNMARNWLYAIQKGSYFLMRPPVCYLFTDRAIRMLLDKCGLSVVDSLLDLRYLSLEKILTLLRWARPRSLRLRSMLQVVPFPIFAYPSHLLVARKADPASVAHP